MMWRVSAPFKGFKPSAAALGKAVTQAALLNSARWTLPHLPDFLTVSKQPFATFRSDTPCLPDLARVLCCGLPPLVLQAIPARTICHAFEESTVVCHFGSTKPYLPSLVKHFLKGSAAPGRQPILFCLLTVFLSTLVWVNQFGREPRSFRGLRGRHGSHGLLLSAVKIWNTEAKKWMLQ